MKNYTVIIADDETYARDELKHILSKIDRITLVGETRNGLETVKLVEEKSPDILLLDIEMPGLNGIDVARNLLKKKAPPHIIFATAYDNYAVKAFELNAIDYILKPFDEARIKKGLSRAISLIDSKENRLENIEKLLKSIAVSDEKYPLKIPVKSKGRIALIDVDQIVYARGEGGLVFIFESGKEFLTDFPSLEKLESELNPKMFYRTHRSYLVNIDKMKEILPLGGGHFMIRCRTNSEEPIEIPLSRRQAKLLREKFKF